MNSFFLVFVFKVFIMYGAWDLLVHIIIPFFINVKNAQKITEKRKLFEKVRKNKERLDEYDHEYKKVCLNIFDLGAQETKIFLYRVTIMIIYFNIVYSFLRSYVGFIGWWHVITMLCARIVVYYLKKGVLFWGWREHDKCVEE